MTNRTSARKTGRPWLILPCILLAQAALAGPAAATDTPAAGRGSPPHVGKAQASTQQQAQLARHQAEVERLQQHVSQLENQNGQASSRLQQQDRDIAELQRQLQAARGAAPAGSGHP